MTISIILFSILLIQVKGNFQPERIYDPTYRQEEVNQSIEQWCTDCCALRTHGGYKKFNPVFTAKSFQYPANYEISQVLDDNNCYCYCPVPVSQDPGYNLCKYNDHSKCSEFCLGQGNKMPVTIVGTSTIYFGGSCVEDTKTNKTQCMCNCNRDNSPME